MDKRTPKSQAVTDIMLAIFRLNGLLLTEGDELVNTLGINSARWQLLGPVASAKQPLTAPQIAEAMGVSRQGAQKQLNIMVAEGFFEPQLNPRHERSPLYALTAKGQRTIDEAINRQTAWATLLAKEFAADELNQTLSLLNRLYDKLPSSAAAVGQK